MMKKLFVAVLFWNFYLQADVLFTETFDNEGTWPSGWTFDQYIDPETGEMLWVDTSSKKMLQQLKKEVSIKQLNFEKKLRKFGIDLVAISTDEDFVDPLLSFFKSREKKI